MTRQDPGERAIASNGRTIAVELVGAACVVLAANLIAAWMGATGRLSPDMHLEVGKWALVDRLDAPVDWVIVGDSSAGFGVTREELESGLGGRAANLATVYHQLLIGDAWMLQRYLGRFGPPRGGVIALHTVNVWWQKVNPFLALLPLPWGYWERLEPAVPFTPALKRRYLTQRYLTLWAEHQRLGQRVKNLGRMVGDEAIGERGFITWGDTNARAMNVMLEGRWRDARRSGDRLSVANRRGLEVLTRLADRHGFELFIGNGPICALLQDDPAYRSDLEAASGLLDYVARRSPRVHHILRVPMAFPVEDMHSPDHLLHPAAQRFTRELVREVQAAKTL